nr:unnamed protein product [Callosobruchus chinensis]
MKCTGTVRENRLARLFAFKKAHHSRKNQRSKKWYFCLFAHMLDMASQIAWQLHKHNGGKMDHLAFRRCIASGLLETYKKETKRGPAKLSKYNHFESRYDRLDHLVIYQTNKLVVHCATNKQRSDARNVTLHFILKFVF